MKTIDMPSDRAIRALVRPAIALAVSAVLGAAALALPAQAAGQGDAMLYCAQMHHGQPMKHEPSMAHGQQMQPVHGQSDRACQSHGAAGHANAAGPRHQASHHGRLQDRDVKAQHHRAGMFLSEPMLNRIQATAEQKTRIREIMMAARKDLQAQRGDAKALRDQGMKLFSQPEIDPKAIEEFRVQSMARHDAASKRMTQAMIEAGQVLTPEQRQQLAQYSDHRREMMRRHHEERRALEAPRS
jgi:Spy/CpxP family protein refolding chaperone